MNTCHIYMIPIALKGLQNFDKITLMRSILVGEGPGSETNTNMQVDLYD